MWQAVGLKAYGETMGAAAAIRPLGGDRAQRIVDAMRASVAR